MIYKGYSGARKNNRGGALQLQDLIQTGLRDLGKAEEKDKQMVKVVRLEPSLGTLEHGLQPGSVRGAEFEDCFPHLLMYRELPQGKAEECALPLGDAVSQPAQLQLSTHRRPPEKSGDKTGDHKGFQPRKGRAWLPPAALLGPANHSQLSAERKQPWYFRGFEKKCEQMFCQVWADVVLASPKVPGLQHQDCCWGERGEDPPGHTLT